MLVGLTIFMAKDGSLSDADDELDFNQAEKLVRQRQRFRRRPKKSANLVAQLMARKGYGQQQAIRELDDVWSAIAADTWRMQTRVGVIRGGILEVVFGNSVLNKRLEFDKKRLLAELQRQLPKNNIRDIRFRIGNL
jgi:hypothetical protein